MAKDVSTNAEPSADRLSVTVALLEIEMAKSLLEDLPLVTTESARAMSLDVGDVR